MSTESKHGSEKPKTSLPRDDTPELSDEALAQISGGPKKNTDLDHMGSYNFYVEIEGVTQDTIHSTDDLTLKARKPD